MQSSSNSVSSRSHAVPVNHTRILSRFFFSPDQALTGFAGHMKLKVTKASAAATTDNRSKTIPHALYDDPAFSADPSSNPLCSASHDINCWITDPPKGHPAINSLSERRVAPIPPPNSPVSLHDWQQPSVSMTRFPATSNLSPPNLSLMGSSAADSGLTSRSSLNIPQTSAAGENKKRISFSFFKRRSNPEGTSTHRLVNHTKALSEHAISASKHTKPDSHTPPVMNGFAQSARALDMIDELDESNPLGIPLHHGGPYEAIQRNVASNAYETRRAPSKLEEQPRTLHNHTFRFDVPLGLSPGQVLPHSVTAYYRPQVTMNTASFHDRLGLRQTIQNQPVDQVSRPAMNWNVVDQHVMAPSAMGRSNMYIPPPNPVHEQSIPLQFEHRTQPINGRGRGHAPQVLSEREPQTVPPVNAMGRLTISEGLFASVDRDAGESGLATEESDDMTRIGEQLMTGECLDMDDDDQGPVDTVPDKPDNIHLPYPNGAGAQSRFLSHESPRNISPPPPYGLSRNTPPPPQHGLLKNTSPPPPQLSRNTPPPPPHGLSRNIAPIPYGSPTNTPPPSNMFLSPLAPHDPYRRQALPPGSLIDRRVYQIHPSPHSSSSSIRSGAASTMTGFTGVSSATSSLRNRILPKQLVMPAPLAKAAASSRPQPTHLPQSVQALQDMQRQHRIRFHDGGEYDLPVTTSNSNWTPSAIENPSVHHAETQTRTPSIMRSSKLKKQKSLRGPEPPEIMARLAAGPQVRPSRKYMEPPPTIPEAPRTEGYIPKVPVKRLLGKRMTIH